MTSPNLPANVVDEYGSGLEDIENEVGAVPRIGINHSGGTFKDSLSGEEFPEIWGVALGMVKQRVFWPAVVEDGAKPMCKSQDATTGYPNPAPEKDGGFPWSDAAGLDPNTAPLDEHGRKLIQCETCPFAQWGKDTKTGKNTPPLCKERHTYPIIFNREGMAGMYNPPYMESGIVSFQGSGISPSKKYLAAFVRNKRPLYSAVVRIKLNTAKRGNVIYSVPEFAKVADVPQDDWELYGRELQPLRDYLRAAPRANDDGSDPVKAGQGHSAAQAAANVGVSNVSTEESPVTEAVRPTTAPAASGPMTQPVQAYEPPAAPAEDDDDLPF
jgi:hypothetical protein